MEVRRFKRTDREEVVTVWDAAGLLRPWNDPYRDIDRKLAVDPEGFLVAETEGAVVGAVMVGYDGHRGWIQYLAVHPDHQRTGVGKQLLEVGISELRSRGCPKINLQVRRSNKAVIEFYERHGFLEDDVLSMGLRLVEDGPSPAAHQSTDPS